MRYSKNLLLLFFIAFLIISLDQIWKYIMVNILTYGHSVPLIKGFFSLTLVFNTGAAFGILPGKHNLFLILQAFTIILIFVLYIKSKNKNEWILPVALLIGGTFGNFIDRIQYGYVVDFFDFYWHTYHWPAFNFADATICMGVVLLIAKVVRQKPATSN